MKLNNNKKRLHYTLMGGFLSSVSQNIGHEFDPFNINNKARWFKVKPLAPFFFLL